MSHSTREWRPVSGFPYEVSEDGMVCRSKGGSNNTKPGRLLKGYVDKNGYTVVRLSRNGLVYDRKVHRLVCEAFHGAGGSLEVRHLDGNPRNNHYSNLKWGTALQNAADRSSHGRTRSGEKHPRAVLTTEQVIGLRTAYAQMKQERILRGRQRVPRGWIKNTAKQYGIARNSLVAILAGRGY